MWYLTSLEAFQGWILPLDQLLIFPFSPPNAFPVLTPINHWKSQVLQLTFESCYQLKFVVRYFYHTTNIQPFPYHSWLSTISFLPLLSHFSPKILLPFFVSLYIWRCAGLHAISRKCHTVNLSRDPRKEHSPCVFPNNSKCFICLFDCCRALNWHFLKSLSSTTLRSLSWVYKTK